MKAFPAGMEFFPSANDEQWAFIQREIESSDYYIVITAGKYGSLAAGDFAFRTSWNDLLAAIFIEAEPQASHGPLGN